MRGVVGWVSDRVLGWSGGRVRLRDSWEGSRR